MPRALLAFLSAALLVASVEFSWAQPAQDPASELAQVATEAGRFFEELDENNSEHLRRLLVMAQRILDLEPMVKDWQFPGSRNLVRANAYLYLGSVYAVRQDGDILKNLEFAISWLNYGLMDIAAAPPPEKQLEVFQNLTLVKTQITLATVYGKRFMGERAANVDLAIDSLQAALKILTLEEQPVYWSMAKLNLGTMYIFRVRGDRRQNIQLARQNLEDSLKVLKKDEVPVLFGAATSQLALTYYQQNYRQKEAREKAIELFQTALQFLTPENYLESWAVTQLHLGATYANRIVGDREENFDKALDAFGQAMKVITRQSRPREWSLLQENIASIYYYRAKGDRRENLRWAIESARAALTIYPSPEQAPLDYRRLNAFLTRALLASGDFRGAQQTSAAAIRAHYYMLGNHLSDMDANGAIEGTGELFSNAAYAAAQGGDLRRAITLLDEGRTQLLTRDLRDDSVGLSAELSGKLRDINLEIEKWLNIAKENTEGKRAFALEEVTELRAKVQQLIGVRNIDRETAEISGIAESFVREGSVVVAPIVTALGGKIIIVSPSASFAPVYSEVDFEGLSKDGLDRLLGIEDPEKLHGYLHAYIESHEKRFKLAKEISLLEYQAVNLAKMPPALSQKYLPNVALELTQKRSEFSELEKIWYSQIDDIGIQLGKVFGEQLQKKLSELSVKPGTRLIILPPPLLRLIPLGLMRLGENAAVLSEQYEVVFAPNLRILSGIRARIVRSAPPSLTIISNPAGDLKYAGLEPALLASYLAADSRKIIQPEDATPVNAMKALSGSSFWHFATHGVFYLGGDVNGALILREKNLTVADLMAARKTNSVGQPRLVSLAACESGLIDFGNRRADEFVGFPGAFIGMGAAGVVSTLWPVDDRATLLLMAKFYDLIFNGKLTPPAALRTAQIWLKASTKTDLLAFAKNKLDTEKFATLSSGFEGIQMRVVRGIPLNLALDLPDPRKQKPDADPPFAHPFYWAGFVYDGL